jgi:hypothetical protein
MYSNSRFASNFNPTFRSFNRPSGFRFIWVLMIIAAVVFVAVSFFNQTNVETVENCKVINLQQQQLISGTDGNLNTDIRYLVITDKETFICETSMLNMKFNNSDIYWRLKIDSVYNFKVAGFGKSILTQYRNILSYEKK